MESPVCPYLKGSHDGAVCGKAGALIRETAQADLYVCLSEHFAYCPVEGLFSNSLP